MERYHCFLIFKLIILNCSFPIKVSCGARWQQKLGKIKKLRENIFFVNSLTFLLFFKFSLLQNYITIFPSVLNVEEVRNRKLRIITWILKKGILVGYLSFIAIFFITGIFKHLFLSFYVLSVDRPIADETSRKYVKLYKESDYVIF